ncbi:MAG: hypothetical protein OXU45_08570, partial [Candidatus Melainabacteria bacterium]|nr:hypothetical protein [Candidatus Melainabacteria bacterium]
MEILYTAAKIIASLVLVLVALVLLVLAFRSKTIIKALELIDGSIHGASAAILTQGSMLAMILPLVSRNQSKSNICNTIFKISPLAIDERIMQR